MKKLFSIPKRIIRIYLFKWVTNEIWKHNTYYTVVLAIMSFSVATWFNHYPVTTSIPYELIKPLIASYSFLLAFWLFFFFVACIPFYFIIPWRRKNLVRYGSMFLNSSVTLITAHLLFATTYLPYAVEKQKNKALEVTNEKNKLQAIIESEWTWVRQDDANSHFTDDAIITLWPESYMQPTDVKYARVLWVSKNCTILNKETSIFSKNRTIDNYYTGNGIDEFFYKKTFHDAPQSDEDFYINDNYTRACAWTITLRRPNNAAIDSLTHGSIPSKWHEAYGEVWKFEKIDDAKGNGIWKIKQFSGGFLTSGELSTDGNTKIQTAKERFNMLKDAVDHREVWDAAFIDASKYWTDMQLRRDNAFLASIRTQVSRAPRPNLNDKR